MVLLIHFKTPLSPKSVNKEPILSVVKSPSRLLYRQSYDGLEKKLKEVFSERSGILQQLSKTSKELDSIKGNLQVGTFLATLLAYFSAFLLQHNSLRLNINVQMFSNLANPPIVACLMRVTGNTAAE